MQRTDTSKREARVMDAAPEPILRASEPIEFTDHRERKIELELARLRGPLTIWVGGCMARDG